MPRTLLAAICSPWPLPPTTIPRSARAGGDEPRDVGADRRIVGRRVAVGAAIVDVVPEPDQRRDEVFLQRKARMVGPDRDAHKMGDYSWKPSSWKPEAERSWKLGTVTITRRGEDRARAGHPWIYRSDVIAADAAAGDLVQVTSERGRPVGHALFSDESEITLRMIAFGPAAPAADFIERRLAAAIAYRDVAGARRDGVPARARRGGPAAVAGRRSVRRLPRRAGAVAGDRSPAAGDHGGAGRAGAPAGHPRAQRSARPAARGARAEGRSASRRRARRASRCGKGRVAYEVDPWKGQKTGLFLDQRENREAALRYARGRLLDAFSYNGGFALALAPRVRRRCSPSTSPTTPSPGSARTRRETASATSRPAR